ncbi:MAG: aldo/keto reductase [Armatimonadetes bacterium]|nr:aldo/keto reductase [Armatimonadota bacterium]MDW8121847.1 aldo/keto reductase [Armatimonadota bacterium]
MRHRILGKTGMWVSEIAFGCAYLGTRPADRQDAINLVRKAVDLGITLFDTADIYGGGVSEEIVGDAVREVRDQIVLATKVRGKMGPGPNDEGLSRYHIVRACEASLRRLKTDRIDLYQVHWTDPNTPIEETLEALDYLVRSGKVLHIGCSNFAAWQVAKGLWVADRKGLASFRSVQPPYSLINRDAERELFPFCLSEGIGAIVYSPLGGGFLAKPTMPDAPPVSWARAAHYQNRPELAPLEKRAFNAVHQIAKEHGRPPSQIALAWVLHQEAVTAAITAATNEEQLKETVRSWEVKLSDEEIRTLDEATRIG